MGDNKLSNGLPGIVSSNFSNTVAGIAKNNPAKIVLERYRNEFNPTDYLKAITDPFVELRLSTLKATVKEQDKAYERDISKGYAYSTYYHLITRVIHRHEYQNYVDALIDMKLLDFVLNKLQKVEDSEYVKSVFESINRENLTHNIPLFTLLIERLMRILTDKVEDNIKLFELRQLIEKSLENYKVFSDENLVKEEIKILEREVSENAKNLYEKTLTYIVEKDFMQSEDKVKGNILNRHTLLHGKQDFDKLNEDEAMKLIYLILFFLDLIELKNQGTLVFE